MPDRIYTPFEFASKLRRSVPTLRRWAKEGKLIAFIDFDREEYYTHGQYLEMVNAGESLEIFTEVESDSKSVVDPGVDVVKKVFKTLGEIEKEKRRVMAEIHAIPR